MQLHVQSSASLASHKVRQLLARDVSLTELEVVTSVFMTYYPDLTPPLVFSHTYTSEQEKLGQLSML